DEPQPAWSEEDPFANRQEPASGEPVTSAPLDGACSAASDSAATSRSAATNSNGASDCGITPSQATAVPDPIEIRSARLMERRLLALVDFCGPDDADRRGQLQEPLAAVRREKAEMELRLSASQSGAEVTTQPVGGNSKYASVPADSP